MKTTRGWLGLLILAILLGQTEHTFAFGIGTHRLLNEKTVLASQLDDYLKSQLGLTNGILEEVAGKQVIEWVGLGGAAEDEFLTSETLGAAFRSRHHFHNPLQPWDQAGLAGQCLGLIPVSGKASVRWAQDPGQGLIGQAAWADARQAFLQSLTLPSKAERDAAWAKTFQILGQQMHLVADLAAPAHTRNDLHCMADGFEAWASTNGRLIQDLLAAPPVRPDPAIFSLGVPINDPIAKVPIARLGDSDQYNGGNPDVTLSPTIGLAEYTNANFLSDDTVFSLDLPFPAPTSVELGPPEPEPKTGELRRYFKKVRDGELIDHLAVPSALYDFLPEALQDDKKGLDEKVFRDYGEKLLPRAVGYSAALLDYFFRGRLFTFGDTATLAFANYNREPMEGSFTLYYDDVEKKRYPVPGASWTLTLGVGAFVNKFPFSEPVDPTPLDPGSYTLVFRGAFGGETEAVVGKQVVIPSVITVRLLTRIYGNPLEGYRIEVVEKESGKVFSWGRTDRNGKTSLRWKAGKTLIRIQSPFTREQIAYWAGEQTFSSASEGAKAVTNSDIDSKGELTVPFPLFIRPNAISAVEPCTGFLTKEIPCRAAGVDCLADDSSWKRPSIDNYWPSWDGVAGSLLSSSGVPTGEAVFIHGGVSSAIFIRDDLGEKTVIGSPGPSFWTGKRIVPDALHAEDLNKMGVPIGRLIVSYWSEHTRYFENEDGEMIGRPICRNTYNETESLPVWLAEDDFERTR